jgi:hypothetical protein
MIERAREHPYPLDRSSAVTVMLLADVAARTSHPGHRICSHIGNSAAEPGGTTPQAPTLAIRRTETTSGREPAASPPGREAARL